MKKIAVLFILGLLCTGSFAKDGLPFIGTRFFEFTDGNCNGHSITIQRTGKTIITTGDCSMNNWKKTMVYQGIFKEKMRILNTNWSISDKYVNLEVSSKTASLVDKSGGVFYSEGCSHEGGDKKVACLSPLHK